MSGAIASRAFDTSNPGMPESQWSDWTSQAPEWIPPTGELIVVAPHPDDETLGAGGLIFTCSRRDMKVTVICITDGEAACPEIPALAAVRRGELVSAMHELGLAQSDIRCLGMPDGKLADREADLAKLLADCIPAGAIVVAPFESDGHADHEAAARACRSAARAKQLSLVRYPIWAWHRGSPELLMERRAVRFTLDASARRAKGRAVSQFRSQTGERPGGPIVPAHVLHYFNRPYELFLL